MKIYTRTGDKGTTSLVGGTRVAKTSPAPKLTAPSTNDGPYGLFAGHMENHPQLTRYRDELLQVLDHLMRLSSYLATEEEAKKYLPAFDGTQVALLEQWIDGIQSHAAHNRQIHAPRRPSDRRPLPYRPYRMPPQRTQGHFPERTISCQ